MRAAAGEDPARVTGTGREAGEAGEAGEAVSGADSAPPGGREGYWCWMVVLGAWLVSFLLSGFTLSFTIVYQQLKHHYGGSAAETAWVLATYGAVRMFSSPMVSALCNAYSHRQVALVGGVVNAVAMVVSGYTPSLNWLYFIFGMVGGFSSNMVYLPPFPVIGYYFERRRGLAMALASTGSGLGGVVMAPLLEMLYRVYGYSGGMLIIGGLMLNCCMASALLRPIEKTVSGQTCANTPTSKPEYKQSEKLQVNQSAWYYGSVASFGSFLALDKTKSGQLEKDALYTHKAASRTHLPLYHPLSHAEDAKEQSRSDPCLQLCHCPASNSPQNQPGTSWREGERLTKGSAKMHRIGEAIHSAVVAASVQMDLPLLAQPDFILYCLMMLGYYICFTTTNTFISGIALNLGFTDQQVALMLTISYALDTPSRLISGALFDVHTLRHLHVPIMTGLGLVAAMTAILLPFPSTVPGLFVLWASYQFLFNGNQAQQVPLTVEIVGVDKAMSACGLARVFMGVGEVIGPTMGGAIKDSTGSYEWAFYIAGGSFIVGCLVFQTYDMVRRVRQLRTRHSLKSCPADCSTQLA